MTETMTPIPDVSSITGFLTDAKNTRAARRARAAFFAFVLESGSRQSSENSGSYKDSRRAKQRNMQAVQTALLARCAYGTL
jgi:hypothetical protein